MTQDSWFITPGVTHSFHASKTSPSTPIHFFQQRIIFDTGDPNFGGMPENDWNLLVNAIGAEYNEDSGDWWFPCESKLEIDLHGSEGVVYGINLSDPDTLDPNTGLCAATLYSMGPGADNWCVRYYTNFFDPSIYAIPLLQDYGNAILLKVLSHFPLRSESHGISYQEPWRIGGQGVSSHWIVVKD
jgi:hypothetical protein